MFGLGNIVGKIITAPIKILDLPNKVIDSLNGEQNTTIADKVSEAIEDQTKNILGE